MPLVPVQNRKPGPTVFTNFATQDVVNWEGYGDPSGNDVQFVPEDYLSMPAFQKSMQKGVFQILRDDEGAEAQTRAIANNEASLAAEQATVEQSIKRESTRDLVQLDCVGPSTRDPRIACGTPVPLYATAVGSTPPLCNMHEGLVNEYVPMEGEVDPSTGKAVVTWVRAQVDPNRQAQL